jgi:hypothetical protein
VLYPTNWNRRRRKYPFITHGGFWLVCGGEETLATLKLAMEDWLWWFEKPTNAPQLIRTSFMSSEEKGGYDWPVKVENLIFLCTEIFNFVWHELNSNAINPGMRNYKSSQFNSLMFAKTLALLGSQSQFMQWELLYWCARREKSVAIAANSSTLSKLL